MGWSRFGAGMVACGLGLALAGGARAETKLVSLAPKTAFSKPTHQTPKVQANAIVADNVRAVAVLWAVHAYEKAGLFRAGERLAADGKLKAELPSAAVRAEMVAFVAKLIAEQFAAIVKSSSDQMDAYGALVSSVAQTVDQFASDGVAENGERDFLHAQAVAVSNSGYAAAHWAAAELGKHAHEITHVVQQGSVQKAYGAKDAADLVAKLSKRKRADVEREMARAEAGSALLAWLRHASQKDQLALRAKKDGVAKLAKRLKELGLYRKHAWRKGAKAPIVKPLCLPPGTKKPKPC